MMKSPRLYHDRELTPFGHNRSEKKIVYGKEEAA